MDAERREALARLYDPRMDSGNPLPARMSTREMRWLLARADDADLLERLVEALTKALVGVTEDSEFNRIDRVARTTAYAALAGDGEGK